MRSTTYLTAPISVDGLKEPVKALIRMTKDHRYFVTAGTRGKGTTTVYLRGNPREGFRMTKSEIEKVLPVCSESFLRKMLESVR